MVTNLSMIPFARPLILLVILFSAPTLAWAHKVSMFAYVEGDQIFLEGYFSDRKKAVNSKVEAFDSQGRELWSGTTNDKGEVTFPVPKIKGDLRVTLTASMGHKAEYVIKAAEMAGEDGADSATGQGGSVVAADGGPAVGGETVASGGAAAINEARLRRIVRREVGEAVMPVVRGLSELKTRRGFSDIVGGIGLIFGVMGFAFYMQARKIRAGGGKT